MVNENDLNIEYKHSPNQTKGRIHKPQLIVCHITDGAYEGAVNWLCNTESKASAHYVVARDGRISQLVDIGNTAWANGTSKNPERKVYYGDATSSLVQDLKGNANHYSISIEHEGIYRKTHGRLSFNQLNATIDLIRHIQSQVIKEFGTLIPFDRDHIIGHYEVNPLTRPHCPGEDFPFDEIIHQLNQ